MPTRTTPSPIPVTASIPTLTSSPTPIPTPTPLRILTVCLGREPQSLFLYQAFSSSALSVLQAIYDGPFDVRDFDFSPTILASKPSIASGDVTLAPVEVNLGDLVVDDTGNLAQLDEGVVYRPSGCSQADCALTYSGDQPVTLDQLVVQFKLLPGLRWSDGMPLTADDSLYSYEIVRGLYPLVQAERVLRTASYQALDELTVEWRGIPGYLDALYNANFFSPLPRHAWGALSPAELLQAEPSTRTPLGWGPYVIDEWTPGDHITLRKNPAYFRAGEGLPHFDNLIYRFVEDSDEAMDALQAGECDLADPTAMQNADLPSLLQLQETGNLKVFSLPAAAWEWAAFGITSFDEQRPALFGLKETRQAVAMCIDRQKIADQLFYGQSAVLDSYVPDFHPLANPDVRRYAYDPAGAAKVLDATGWRDPDNDPATPRISQGVKGVPDGTPFEFTYLLISSDAERPQAAQMIQASLAGCGIYMEIGLPDGAEYLASGPQGAVFGRNFDMAQFALPLTLEPPCTLYTGREIPGPYPEFPKGWGGANVSGYQNSDFDLACQAARFSLPDTPQHRQAHFQAQVIFAEDLPVIPLYLRPQVFAARPDFCGVVPDPSASSILWNLEQWDYGEECGK